jgi:Ca2+:H+ antiporter
MGLGVPTAFFAALDRGSLANLLTTDGVSESGENVEGLRIIALLSDERRGDFLKMSRAIALILLVVYVFHLSQLPPPEWNWR